MAVIIFVGHDENLRVERGGGRADLKELKRTYKVKASMLRRPEVADTDIACGRLCKLGRATSILI
jgi:hypothetical protein